MPDLRFNYLVTLSNFNTFYESIDFDFWRRLCAEKGVFRSYGKGELFVQQGCVAKYIGYIKTGTLKYVACAEDGSESVVGLEFAGEFVADFPFSIFGMKSRISIEAVTPSEIYCFPVRDIAQKMKSDEELNKKIAEANVSLFDTVYSRYIDMYTKTAQQRYEELITKHEDIFSLFSLKDIASFLNITPTHLSRLRKP